MSNRALDQPFRFIRNSPALLGHGPIALRHDALAIVEQVLWAVNPFETCCKLIHVDEGVLVIHQLSFALHPDTRIWFLGAGKASLEIARAVEHQLGDRLHAGLVVCKEGEDAGLERIEIRYASHPIPNTASVNSGREMAAWAGRPRPGDIVLCGITGGSSALLTLPPKELSLGDLQTLTEILLTCGASIFEINAVRKHVSGIGGGRLAQMFSPGVHLINLTVSDVIGDALDYITDPTVADTSTVADARATLDRYNLWDRVPLAVRTFLGPGGAVSETPKLLPWPSENNVVLISAAQPADVAQCAARALGYTPFVLSTSFEGESQSLGETFAAIAREIMLRNRPISRPCALIGGGETVVRMDHYSGLGGPNQEFALTAACGLPSSCDAVVLGIDTDGSDGPTQIAGALCDADVIRRAKGLGVDIREALHRHNVTPALLALDDAITTGATGTNVNDLKLLLVGPLGQR